jgi:hypothetical protein
MLWKIWWVLLSSLPTEVLLLEGFQQLAYSLFEDIGIRFDY